MSVCICVYVFFGKWRSPGHPFDTRDAALRGLHTKAKIRKKSQGAHCHTLSDPKLLVGRTHRQKISLRNEGVLPATFSVSQPSVPGSFACVLCGQSISLPAMAEQTGYASKRRLLRNHRVQMRVMEEYVEEMGGEHVAFLQAGRFANLLD